MNLAQKMTVAVTLVVLGVSMLASARWSVFTAIYYAPHYWPRVAANMVGILALGGAVVLFLGIRRKRATLKP